MSGVTDRARVLRVRSELDESGSMFIAIEDTGSGIDPKNLANVFEPFFTTKSNGMGVGLSICRTIIESHGGRLTATSAHPHGSVFQVIFAGVSPNVMACEIFGSGLPRPFHVKRPEQPDDL